MLASEELNKIRIKPRFAPLALFIILVIAVILLTLYLRTPQLTPVVLPGQPLQAPYPDSPLASKINFNWSTLTRLAPGSDNWTITWADDGHQYTTWGDGGGFGGTNRDGRVSLGYARVEGPKDNFTGVNVWGGIDAENPAQFTGKSYGIISIDGVLYTWRCGHASEETAYEFQELYRSTNRAATWEFTGVRFDQDSFPGADRGFFCPTFLQFGQDYQGARDNYVYIYAPEIKTNQWAVHKPGEITLMRVPKESLDQISQYQYFSGLSANGNPTWSADVTQRAPAFQDVANGVMRTSVNYNAGLGFYFLITEHTARSGGNIGIYEAPEPWGPWHTVLFQTGFGAPHIQSNTFYWNFSSKWFSEDGLQFVLIFTGRNENDSWNSVEGSFDTASLDHDMHLPLISAGAPTAAYPQPYPYPGRKFASHHLCHLRDK